MALTQKQELFCQNVVAGMSYKDAYINAYDTNAKDTTIRTESARLALREDIQERIRALSKPLEIAAQVAGMNVREKQLQEIDERIEVCKAKEDEQSLIRWMDMKNKLLGLYKDNEDNKENDNNLTNINTDLLAKIAKIG